MSTTALQAVPRRDRAAIRRAQILEASAAIMTETGYHEMSMQAVAERAGISVGLIYQYFGGKQELLAAVIIDILEDFASAIPQAMAQSDAVDPLTRLRAGFAAFVRTIDAKRPATLLAYRETMTLPTQSIREMMRLETATIAPLREAVAEGIIAGTLRDVSPDLVAHSLKMAAHGWALKHWDLSRRLTVDEYINEQLDLLLVGLEAR